MTIYNQAECFIFNSGRNKSEKLNLMGSITVQLASCLFFLVSVALPMLNKHLFFLFGQIQISQTGGQLYGDTSPMVSVLWF